MTEPKSMSLSSPQSRAWLRWLPQNGVLIYLLAVLLAFLLIPLYVAGFPPAERLAFFTLPYLIGWVYLGCAVWVFTIRRNTAYGRSFIIFAISTALCTAGLFDLLTTHRMAMVWYLAAGMAGAAVIDLALTFPQEERFLQDRPWMRWGLYGVGLALGLNLALRLPALDSPATRLFALLPGNLFAGGALLFAVGWLAFRRLPAAAGSERSHLLFVTIAGLLSLGPVAIWLIGAAFGGRQTNALPYLLLSMPIFPVVMGVVIQRFRTMRSDYLFSRAILYTAMAVLVALGYALLVSGLGLLFNRVLLPDSPLVMGLALFILALAIHPLRQQLERAVDVIFFRGERAYQERLQGVTGELTRAVNLPEIQKIVSESVARTLMPERLYLFLLDGLSQQYMVRGGAASDLVFLPTSGLVHSLESRQSALVLPAGEGLPAGLQNEQTRLRLLGASVYVPLPGRERLAGWLALGPRLSGEPYTPADLKFLEGLCGQAALAIERAQAMVSMENRVHEMNVLARVAQGINITLNLDDILELVNAQTTQVIPSNDFRMMLTEPGSSALRQIFCVVDDERLKDQENQSLESSRILESEVIQHHRPLQVSDYPAECSRRGIEPVNPRVRTWMCVPLNAGAGAIGTLSVGSHDSGAVYSSQQLNLLLAIANQAAGAIVKARLLQETERRARQLVMLNEVTRQLTSTLELEPLLQNILQNAVEILNCEAGSLLLRDETSDELVYRAAAGPLADSLLHKRVPLDTGIVGQAVASRAGVMVNDMQAAAQGASFDEAHYGFSTRALMVLPLTVKDRVIGAVEVINRKDGLPFTRDDEELLSAFTGQAAVAIENARLYMSTDQALAARVEELSVMQRIDRELNTSLDIARAMNITLTWAMRQSGANAGWVGTVHEDGVKVMASQGYADELAPYAEAYFPVDRFDLANAIETGETQRVQLGDDIPGLLAGAHSMTVLPIRREAATIGVMLLESTGNRLLSEDTMTFLNRLTDHASIAISNAQLVAAAQSANLAKSEFVSFVSHELKNPMTSIKGYTELLAAGAVGPINEMQANFLSTIRTNVERMSTLVSDLADVSRIEAGRLKLDFKANTLMDIVEEVIRSLRKQVEEKQQTLDLQIPGELPAIWADRVRVLQVITNLVSNAYKYTQKGGTITVGAEACDNQWDAIGARRVIHLWVTDTGIGISPEDQKKIFQKFFRSEDPKTREAPGTGLGLNITRSLVEMQGGRIWFESEFRKGTTFHMTVPVAES